MSFNNTNSNPKFFDSQNKYTLTLDLNHLNKNVKYTCPPIVENNLNNTDDGTILLVENIKETVAIGDLSDVNVTNPQQSDVLKYQASTGTYENSPDSIAIPDNSGLHDLTLKWNETATANRTLNVILNDQEQTLELEAPAILDQDLTQDSNPKFDTPNVSGVDIIDQNGAGSFFMNVANSETLTANHGLDIKINDGNRLLVISDNAFIDQDYTGTGDVNFKSLKCSDLSTESRILQSGTNGLIEETAVNISDVPVNDDVILRDGTNELSADWDAGSHKITAETFESDIITGTAPLIVSSSTKCINLNADKCDGYDFDQSLLTTDNVTYNNLQISNLNIPNGILRTDGTGVVSSAILLPSTTTGNTAPLSTNNTLLATTEFVKDVTAFGFSFGEYLITSGVNFENMTKFIFLGTDILGTPTSVTINAWIDAGAPVSTGQIRLINNSAGGQIVGTSPVISSTSDNNTVTISPLNPLYVSSGQTLWAIQGNSTNMSKYINLSSITFNF